MGSLEGHCCDVREQWAHILHARTHIHVCVCVCVCVKVCVRVIVVCVCDARACCLYKTNVTYSVVLKRKQGAFSGHFSE